MFCSGPYNQIVLSRSHFRQTTCGLDMHKCLVSRFQVSYVSRFTGVSSPFRIHFSASVHSKAPNCFRHCLNVSWMACSHFNEVICMTQISSRVQPGPGPTQSHLFSCLMSAANRYMSHYSLKVIESSGLGLKKNKLNVVN